MNSYIFFVSVRMWIPTIFDKYYTSKALVIHRGQFSTSLLPVCDQFVTSFQPVFNQFLTFLWTFFFHFNSILIYFKRTYCLLTAVRNLFSFTHRRREIYDKMSLLVFDWSIETKSNCYCLSWNMGQWEKFMHQVCSAF